MVFPSVTVDHCRSIEDVLCEAFYPFIPSLVFSQSLISLDLIEDFLAHAHQTRKSGNPLYEGRPNPLYKVRLNPLYKGRLNPVYKGKVRLNPLYKVNL